MIFLLFLAMSLFIAALLLLINAFILWDSENVVKSVNPNTTTTHINVWAIASLIFAIFLLVISLWTFWEYYKSSSKIKENVKTKETKTITTLEI